MVNNSPPVPRTCTFSFGDKVPIPILLPVTVRSPLPYSPNITVEFEYASITGRPATSLTLNIDPDMLSVNVNS